MGTHPHLSFPRSFLLPLMLDCQKPANSFPHLPLNDANAPKVAVRADKILRVSNITPLLYLSRIFLFLGDEKSRYDQRGLLT